VKFAVVVIPLMESLVVISVMQVNFLRKEVPALIVPRICTLMQDHVRVYIAQQVMNQTLIKTGALLAL